MVLIDHVSLSSFEYGFVLFCECRVGIRILLNLNSTLEIDEVSTEILTTITSSDIVVFINDEESEFQLILGLDNDNRLVVQDPSADVLQVDQCLDTTVPRALLGLGPRGYIVSQIGGIIVTAKSNEDTRKLIVPSTMSDFRDLCTNGTILRVPFATRDGLEV